MTPRVGDLSPGSELAGPGAGGRSVPTGSAPRAHWHGPRVSATWTWR